MISAAPVNTHPPTFFYPAAKLLYQQLFYGKKIHRFEMDFQGRKTSYLLESSTLNYTNVMRAAIPIFIFNLIAIVKWDDGEILISK